jgi:hypothetical protein
MPTVLLVRHGQASFGAADYDVLSDLGRRPRRRPLPPSTGPSSNASVTKLAIGSTGINVVSFNDHSHLEAVDRTLVTYR